jgi:F0F1-type ATP synthase delta subunit
VQEGGQIIDPIQQLQAILEQRPDLRQQLESLPPEQRNQVISNLLQPYGVA